MTARSALRRYMLVSFLTWLPVGLMVATMVLLMTERGLGLAQIGLCVTVFSIVTVGLELPTGGLADVVGRRVVLAVSAAFTVAALALMSVSTTFWMFLAGGVLKGVARALSSGPATSWYVDTLHAVEGPDADLRPGLARGGAMESVALCAGVLVGGSLPLLVPPGLMFPLAAPPLLGALAAAALLVVVMLALPEPARAHRSVAGVLREVPATVASGVRLAAGRAVLRRLMLAAAGSGLVLMSIELLTPGRLAELAGTAEEGSLAYAVVAALGFAGSAAGSALAPGVARLVGGSARGAIAGTVLTALSVGTLAATAGLGGPAGLVSAGLAYVTLFVGLSVTGLLCLELTHKAVTAAERTTVASTSSLFLQSGGIVGNLTLGALAAQAGVAPAWALAGTVLLASALLFVRMPAAVPATGPAGRPGVTDASPAPAPPARSVSG
ncbi:MFS transporter [Nonomuraea jiangxiensis]|uniref:Major Facilitator Superfamily protein n=1 Tax=Nonomuraea jiangxiensis TaxID=633440 RepID=A0A1G9KBP2_9ACTN|nr:MFS transporter [Nonomuraea jiangxiensis]SDL47097.1 Major Facilitator Superfamily protein [Nonomuraea jiangxiensis]